MTEPPFRVIDIEYIHAMRDDGLSPRVIAKRIGRKPSHVRTYLRCAGLLPTASYADGRKPCKRYYPCWLSEEIAWLISAVARGLSTEEIAAALGRSPAAIDTKIYILGLRGARRTPDCGWPQVTVPNPEAWLRDKGVWFGDIPTLRLGKAA